MDLRGSSRQHHGRGGDRGRGKRRVRPLQPIRLNVASRRHLRWPQWAELPDGKVEQDHPPVVADGAGEGGYALFTAGIAAKRDVERHHRGTAGGKLLHQAGRHPPRQPVQTHCVGKAGDRTVSCHASGQRLGPDRRVGRQVTQPRQRVAVKAND